MYGDPDGPIGRRATPPPTGRCSASTSATTSASRFQCFAGGLFFGIGSLFALAFNGAAIGSSRRLPDLARLRRELLPVRDHARRVRAERHRARRRGRAASSATRCWSRAGARAWPRSSTPPAGAIVIVYGMTAMFAIAAALEAFWSSARWVAAPVKIGVGAACWVAVHRLSPLPGPARDAAAGGTHEGRRDRASTCGRAAMFEAADLGVRLVLGACCARSGRAARRSTRWSLLVAATMLPSSASGWAVLTVIWLKPWLDRSILFVLARAVFGEETRFADVWAARARRGLARAARRADDRGVCRRGARTCSRCSSSKASAARRGANASRAILGAASRRRAGDADRVRDDRELRWRWACSRCCRG